MFDALKVKNECVQWIRDFFEENGKGCNAVIGISGGKDSSVAAALCVEALKILYQNMIHINQRKTVSEFFRRLFKSSVVCLCC
ncbi:MAG: hypothetical protein IIX21_05545 [Clostridia bacterium]|nr:hypothetical protein [Clostridia bacterium]